MAEQSFFVCQCNHDLDHCLRQRSLQRKGGKRGPNSLTGPLHCCKCGREAFHLVWVPGLCRPDDFSDPDDDDVTWPLPIPIAVQAIDDCDSGMDAAAQDNLTARRSDEDSHHAFWSILLQHLIVACQSNDLDLLSTLLALAPHNPEGCKPSKPRNPPKHCSDITVQVFPIRTPGRDPRTTEQRYRQRSIIAHSNLNRALLNVLITAQRLLLLLFNGRDVSPSFLRTVLNILFSQLAELIHHTYPQHTNNIWPRHSAFAAERKLARDSTMNAYNWVWAASWYFGILTNQFPKICKMAGSARVQELWAQMLAEGFLEQHMLLMLLWVVEELVEPLEAWMEVMERGWSEHY